MLRILVISLFVANLLLFGFQRNNSAVQQETTVAPTVNKDSGIPTIHLFGEMMQDQGLLTGNRQCFSLGPFHTSEDKDEVRLLLQEVSTRINERQTEALVEKGYWVFIPPYGSLLEANEELISLQALGLEDIGVTYDGEWKNAISLGYFMRQENAQGRKKSLESRGYAPKMRVQRQGEPRYWLDYEQSPGSGLIAMDMQNRPNDFMQRSLPCPEEDVVEFTEADSEEPVQVMAQLQVSEDDKQPAPGRSEDLDTGVDIVNVPQERVETSLIQAVETIPEDAVETGQGDIIETEPEGAVETAQGDIIGTEPEDVVETAQGDIIGTEPESVVGTGQEDNIETEPVDAAGIGQQDNIETEPADAAGIGQQDNIETEPADAAGIGQQDNIETEPENAVETGQEDTIGTEPEGAAETGQEDTIETEPEDVVETAQGDIVGTEPEDVVETAQGDIIGTEPESAVETGQGDIIGTEPEDAAGTGQEDPVDTKPGNAVGTGPLDAIETEPESAVETGLDDTLETGQEPADETVPDDTSETGTGEG